MTANDEPQERVAWRTAAYAPRGTLLSYSKIGVLNIVRGMPTPPASRFRMRHSRLGSNTVQLGIDRVKRRTLLGRSGRSQRALRICSILR